MATKQKDSAGKEKRGACASPMVGGSVHTDRRRLRPSASPETSVAKDHGKTRVLEKSSSTAGELSQSRHVPNYLKPTISSKTDVGKHAVVTKKLQHSLERPVPASQVHKAVQSSSARVAAPALKNSAATVARTSSLERVSKVVKAVKSQPPLVKTKSLPPKASSITGGSRKEVNKTSGSKKASEHDDLNVEEEVAKMESPGGDLPSEKHLENVNHNISPAEDVDDAEHLQEEDEHAPEPVAEITENVNEETQVAAVNEADHVDQQNDDDTKKDEEEIIKPHVGLTVKTTRDEEEVRKEEEDKKDEEEEEKQAAKSSSSAVHKRQVGGRNKKESPAYNDVIEETASKLVEKRVNKVRALAGAFETVISLQQPDSS